MTLTKDEAKKILVSLRKATEILEQRLEPKPLKPRSKKKQVFNQFDNMYGKLKIEAK